MIQYIVIPEQKKTIAILKKTRYDAIRKTDKLLTRAGLDVCVYASQLEMRDQYRAVVVCADGDVYSEEEGKRQAKRKLLNKYYADLDERMNFVYLLFRAAMTAAETELDKSIQRKQY